MNRIILILFYCAFAYASLSQNGGDHSLQIRIKTIDADIELDGVLDEPFWSEADAGKNFWQWFPTDSLQAEYQTELKMVRTETHLYVAAICYTPGEAFIVPTLRRDYRAGGSDNISLLFDTFNDKTNGFLFGMNSAGVRREALISNGGASLNGFSTSWDNIWDGEAKTYPDKYICEFAIPFTSIRYNDGVKKWNFNSYRFDLQANERTTWANIPTNEWIFGLSFVGELIFDDPPPKTGANITLIPYVIGSTAKDYLSTNPSEQKANIGADAKIGITAGLNLDVTINPDFSQVEVDRQVANLTRFEINLPERRQFFTENADLFGSFGTFRVNPFFSRRIGVGTDVNTGVAVQNPILYGLRLSGKITNPLRVGLLNMQTAKVADSGLPGTNYTVGVVQHKVFSRSNIGLIMVNKQLTGKYNPEAEDSYNRVIGVDYNFAAPNNRWSGKVYYHQSFSPLQRDDAFAQGAVVRYSHKNIILTYQHDWVGEGYDAKVGFVPRTNFFNIQPSAQGFYFTKKGIINNHGPVAELNFLFTPGFGLSDRFNTYSYEFNFNSTESLALGVVEEFTYLFDDFDPTGTGATPLPGETGYSYLSYFLSFESDRRKLISYEIEPRFGTFYNGRITSLSAMITARFQPKLNISIDANINKVNLPEPYAQSNLFLIGPRIDYTFSKQLFLTTFLQYNDQSDNININARFQWRFKPVSDFFVVYTDNYTADFGRKNRALVMKLNYWLNL